jgi:hypothetical protein
MEHHPLSVYEASAGNATPYAVYGPKTPLAISGPKIFPNREDASLFFSYCILLAAVGDFDRHLCHQEQWALYDLNDNRFRACSRNICKHPFALQISAHVCPLIFSQRPFASYDLFAYLYRVSCLDAC